MDDNLLNGIFGQSKKGKSENDKSKSSKIIYFLIAFFLLVYPFAIAGIVPYMIVKNIDRKERNEHIGEMDYKSIIPRSSKLFGMLIPLGFIINIIFFLFVIPRGYLSTYYFFPLNKIENNIEITYQTVLALVLGGLGMSPIMLFATSFSEKRKIVSKKSQINKIKESKEYKKRLENKFIESQKFVEEYEEKYEIAKAEGDFKELEKQKQVILLGTDENGKPYIINLKELNQHGILPATTGGGKTVVLQIIVEHCIKFGIPCLVVDGKGAKDTREAIAAIAKKYNKKVKEFTDTGDVSYNPVKYGNSVVIRDKLVSLAETESVFYSSASKSLLMSTVQLIDAYGIHRSLENMSNYFLPRNVLALFIEELLQVDPDLLVVEVVPDKKKNGKKIVDNEPKSEKKPKIVDDEFDQFSQLDEDVMVTEYVETMKLDIQTISLEDMYTVVRESIDLLTKRSKELFNQLFVRYEHKENPFYLYATSESLQTNFNMLLDSELGHLFNTEANKNELDLQEATRNGEIVYVALDGLIYKEFIKTLAQFLISDVNYLCSEKYEISDDFPFFTIFDEPSAYLTETFIDTANKTRGAGNHAIFAPQTLADIEAIDPILLKQLIGNVNTYIVGQTNEQSEVDYWSNHFGSYDDIEITSVTQQEDGFSDLNKTDWVGDKGTQREVENYTIHPNTIKGLRTGEFIIGRKANNVHEQIRKVYMRKPI